MLRKVKLYGQLSEFVGHKEFDVEVNTVGQAVSFLINNFPQLENYMSPKYYQVKVGNFDIDKDEIHYPVGKEDIHFVPVISGAGRGFGIILLGAALIGGAFLMPAGSGIKLMQGIKLGSLANVGLLTKGMLYVGASLFFTTLVFGCLSMCGGSQEKFNILPTFTSNSICWCSCMQVTDGDRWKALPSTCKGEESASHPIFILLVKIM